MSDTTTNDELIYGAAVDITTALIEAGKLDADEAAEYLDRAVRKLRGDPEDRFEQMVLSVFRRLDNIILALEHGPVEIEQDELTTDEPTDSAPKEGRKLTQQEIDDSITDEALICQECGGCFALLTKHLSAAHGLTRDQYLKKWGLPRDYPRLPPKMHNERSEMAKKSPNLAKAQEARAAKHKDDKS
ncbi:ROS/MUCR transcriptional regulator protein [Citromicrobium phage vB_CbaS-RXM]|nr:ROS/MUCR transcriptional regulator protein [Citromicrobium phage vB_CbaS-RXM]